MLNIKERESLNEVYVCGVLKDLNIEEKTTADGRKFVSGVATIRVEQETAGSLYTSEVPVRMFSMEKKSDGVSPNANYARILGYANQFTSLSAVEDPAMASKVICQGQTCNLKENAYFDKAKNTLYQKGFQISGNFLNNKRDSDDEAARFEVVGVLGKTREEMKGDEPTGRLLVDLVVVQYGGKVDVITMVATDGAKSHIETNWEAGDTVKVAGDIVMSFKTIEEVDDSGFGKPIVRKKTVGTRELVITGGSRSGFDPELSYDATDIKEALAQRTATLEKLQTATPAAKATTKPKSGFDF